MSLLVSLLVVLLIISLPLIFATCAVVVLCAVVLASLLVAGGLVFLAGTLCGAVISSVLAIPVVGGFSSAGTLCGAVISSLLAMPVVGGFFSVGTLCGAVIASLLVIPAVAIGGFLAGILVILSLVACLVLLVRSWGARDGAVQWFEEVRGRWPGQHWVSLRSQFRNIKR